MANPFFEEAQRSLQVAQGAAYGVTESLQEAQIQALFALVHELHELNETLSGIASSLERR